MFDTINYRHYGNISVFLFSLYLLSNKYNLLFYYVVGIFFNIILNIVLKGFIQELRPNEEHELLNIALQNSKNHIYKDGIPYSIYGMPSKHAQLLLFSTAFIFLSLRKTHILFIYLLISLIINGLNIWKGYHTIKQVIVGGIIGIVFGYIFYYLAQQGLKGIIREKNDDFAPI